MNEKEQYLSYEKIRVSKITNMFNVNAVSKLSGLTKGQIVSVMENYKGLKNKYGNL